MAYRINCTCGYVINGDDEEELYRDAEEHMTVLHPELVGNVTREDLLAQGYVTVHSQGRQALLTNAPRAVRGGVSFIF